MLLLMLAFAVVFWPADAYAHAGRQLDGAPSVNPAVVLAQRATCPSDWLLACPSSLSICAFSVLSSFTSRGMAN